MSVIRRKGPLGFGALTLLALLSSLLLAGDAVSSNCAQWVDGKLQFGFECTYDKPQSSGGSSRNDDWEPHVDPVPPAPQRQSVPPQPSAAEQARRAREAEDRRLREEERARYTELLRQVELARREENRRLREAYELTALGIQAHNAGDFAGAIAFYRQALDVNPANSAARNNIAIAERAIERRARQAELVRKDLERRRRNSLDFERVQRLIDRIAAGAFLDAERKPLTTSGTGTDFFMTRSGRHLPGFGDPDAGTSESGRARGGIDTGGGLLGRRTSKPADVPGTGDYGTDRASRRLASEIAALSEATAELDREIQQIQRVRNRTRDPREVKDLSEEVSRLDKRKQALLVRKVKKEEEIILVR